jgi:HK97 family phage major capsid protein
MTNGKLSIRPTATGFDVDGDDVGEASLLSLRAAKVTLSNWYAKFSGAVGHGPMSDQQRRQLGAYRSLNAEVMQTIAQREKEMEEDRAAPDPGSPNADAYYSRLAASRVGLDAGGYLSAHRPRGRRYADLFPRELSMDGWQSTHEFMRTIGLGQSDTRLRAGTFTGGDSSGGFAIPGAILQRWLDLALEDEIVRSRAISWPIPMGAREISVPSWDVGDRSDGTIGGLSIEWESEDPPSDADLQVAKTKLITLHARRGAIYCEATNELLEDSSQFEAQLNAIMARALSYGLDRAFLIDGTGANSPLAIINSPALITHTRNTAGHILWDDVAGMFARLSPSSFRFATWITHTSCLPELMKISIPVGTGGSVAPQALTERDGRYTLFGRECLFTEKVSPLGSLSDLMLCDFSQYAIGLKADARIDKSAHLGFRRNKTIFRIQGRWDGQPVLSGPTQPPNSAATTSPFIVLSA